MSTGNPELFVVCKSCGSEVSPYITECPYCGSRLRKRAPKIDRDGRVAERRRRRPPTPALPRLRRGEIPGIRTVWTKPVKVQGEGYNGAFVMEFENKSMDELLASHKRW